MTAQQQQQQRRASAKTAAGVVLFTFVLYWAHRILQLQHYKHCRADLFRVVLYSQSTMCTHTASLLNIVEVVYQHAIKLLASQALGALGGSGGAAAGALAAWLAAMAF